MTPQALANAMKQQSRSSGAVVPALAQRIGQASSAPAQALTLGR